MSLGIYGIQVSQGGSAILSEVSFELDQGTITALIGPNGSGKSTLLKAISGILPLKGKGTSGQVKYKGKDFLSLPPLVRARSIVYVPAELRAEFPMTAQEAVSLGPTTQGLAGSEATVRSAMERCQCWSLRDRDLHTLSGGERQLVGLARALAQGAKVLLLDESLSKMDLHHQVAAGALLKSLAAEGYTIIIVSHDLNLASEWATQAIFLKQGRIVAQGKMQDVFNLKNLKLLYPGAALTVDKSPSSGAPKVFF